MRLAVGCLWLKAHIFLKAGRTRDGLVDAAWRNAQRLSFFFKGEELYYNQSGRNWRELLLLRLLQELDRHGCHSSPQLVIHGLDVLVSNARQAIPTIVVTMHSPVDAVLNRIFRENGIPSSLLAGKPKRVREKGRLLGLEGDLDLIDRSSDTLLAMRRKLSEGRMVLACIDFPRPRPNSYYVDVAISPALFELARKLKVAVLYADTWVASDGRIQAAYAIPRVDLAASSAEAIAQDFIAWLQTEQGDNRHLSVLKWQGKGIGRRGLLALPARSRSL